MSADPLAPIEGARQAALARVHPVAALFPMLDAVALRELADDIAKHGLLEPIVILDGVLLDGRNREAACELAGVDPIYREWMGDESEITAWILSKNIHRRHLDASQRAMVAGRLAELGQGQRVIAAAVETGKSAGLKTGERQFSAAPTQAEAARLLNVGERTVREARAVVTDGASELAAAVDRGEVAVSTAAALTRRVPDKETQRQIVTELGEEGVRVFAAPPSPSPAAHPGEEERPTVQAPGTAEAGASSSGATGGGVLAATPRDHGAAPTSAPSAEGVGAPSVEQPEPLQAGAEAGGLPGATGGGSAPSVPLHAATIDLGAALDALADDDLRALLASRKKRVRSVTRAERIENDAYYTPDRLAQAILTHLHIQRGSALEPSGGGGAFARALAIMCDDLTVVDIDPAAPVFGLDLGDSATLHPGVDFLAWETDRRFDWIVGNPEYANAEAHVRRALPLLKTGGLLVFLLRTGFGHAAKRRHGLFMEQAMEISLPVVPRPSFTGDGKTDGSDYNVFVWRKTDATPPSRLSPWRAQYLDWQPERASDAATEGEVVGG